ncbi:MAG: ABC transporter substrate-binding protein [Chloroflexi bacterium]|nr:ABC transporter substrate-binding protein [Chloroflexota bacterium]
MSGLGIATIGVSTLALLLAGCAPAPVPASAPPAPTTAAVAEPTARPGPPTPVSKAPSAPKSGGTLSISLWDTIGHYDLHQSSSITGIMPFQHAYNNLVQHDPAEPAKIIGDLAQAWEVSTDATAFTFRLFKGVKWHDGRPFTSADAKASLDRMYSPPKGTIVPRVGELMGAIKMVEAPEPDLLKVTLKYASASFVPSLATYLVAVAPKHVLDEKGDLKRTVMGTGPFKFSSDIPDNSFELVKNKEYFKKGLPYLDAVKYYIIKDASTRFAAFRTKRINLTSSAQGFLPSQFDQVKRELPQVQTGQFEGASFIGAYFLTSKQPWNDIRVRRAMHLAVDRQEAVRVLEEGMGTVAGPMAPGPWALATEEVVKLPGYRPAKDEDRAAAKRLLAEAGQSNLKFTLMHRPGGVYQKAAEFYRDQMAKIGVDVTLKPTEYSTLYDMLLRHDFDAALMKLAWTVYDPDDILLQYYRSKAVRNFGDFSDPEVDRLTDEQAKTLDEAKRKEIVLKLQRLIMEKLPIVQTHWVNSVMGWQPEVRNFTRPLSQYSYWRMEEVWLDR